MAEQTFYFLSPSKCLLSQNACKWYCVLYFILFFTFPLSNVYVKNWPFPLNSHKNLHLSFALHVVMWTCTLLTESAALHSRMCKHHILPPTLPLTDIHICSNSPSSQTRCYKETSLFISLMDLCKNIFWIRTLITRVHLFFIEWSSTRLPSRMVGSDFQHQGIRTPMRPLPG